MPSPASLVVKNGSKMRRTVSALMPGPLSRNDAVMVRPLARVPMRSVPSSSPFIACSALMMMLRKTCWSWLASTIVSGSAASSSMLRVDVADAQVVVAQLEHALDQRVEVRWVLLRAAAAGEREQVRDDLRGALGLGVDGLDVVARRLFEILEEQELREAHDAGERVVQLVRDAGDELADAGHLLGLEQALLREPGLRALGVEALDGLREVGGHGEVAVALLLRERARAADAEHAGDGAADDERRVLVGVGLVDLAARARRRA